MAIRNVSEYSQFELKEKKKKMKSIEIVKVWKNKKKSNRRHRNEFLIIMQANIERGGERRILLRHRKSANGVKDLIERTQHRSEAEPSTTWSSSKPITTAAAAAVGANEFRPCLHLHLDETRQQTERISRPFLVRSFFLVVLASSFDSADVMPRYATPHRIAPCVV